jgi:hypothetical protein
MEIALQSGPEKLLIQKLLTAPLSRIYGGLQLNKNEKVAGESRT